MTHYLKETPWDKRTLNIDTYELASLDVEAFQETMDKEGHFTVKVDPFFDKKVLEEYGFYYADTLLEPKCKRGELKVFEKEGVSIDSNGDKQAILDIAEHAFVHGRFHRDFHIPNELADLRYVRWLEDLYDQNQVYFLYYQGDIAGFFGFENNKVLLLGISKELTGMGLARPFLTSGCLKMLSSGYDELITSVSAINLASLNLFQSIGFKLKGSVDVYHKLNGKILT
ncbi:GNAT family N-acetyltransferase [Halobacillus shinanisalinarum]|uniref:GNAT family N-acetyltransferase n=1 Tax=Halobacillus shinanisalinarum TaxID=2932258 RepID=A0ABY4GY81_9BACI|nr:GNAT family protein [Halobacillus shinanisalinarum]UOQ92971.1 GNAT family N-acetyltransferase [Halobacillus shinanisalinarum]